MTTFEQEFYSNFFNFKDEDLRKDLVCLTPFPTFQDIYIESLTDLNKAPSTYIVKKGNKWTDLLHTDFSTFVVNDRLKDLLKEASGIHFSPVTILQKDFLSLDKAYYNVSISGKCGKIIKELSKEELATRTTGGPVFLKKMGLYFDPATWDNSDFFVPEGTWHIFTTKKIKELILNSQITNVMMRPITEIENFKL